MKALLTRLEEADKSIGNFVEKIFRRYASVLLSLFGFSLIACAIIISVLLIGSNRNFWRVPLSYEISMPQFAGRIKSQSELHPGTFTVEVDFSETSKWGADGLMSYGVAGDMVNDKNGYAIWTSGIILEAWRPDSRTAGVYEHAVKFIPSCFPSNYKIKDIFFDRGKLKVIPALEDDSLFRQIILNIFGWVFLFFLFMWGIWLIAKNLKKSILPAPAQT